jgi:GntR family transcriptional repressor for pyruvate dehydrogenase complex
MTRVSRRYEVVLEQLLERVMSGDVTPGDWLPREVDLADEFGVSRGVARETIRALKERGVIDVRHGRGAWVQPPERWDVLDQAVITAAARSERHRHLLFELVDCRRLIEPEIARLATRRATSDELAELKVACHHLRTASAGARHSAADRDPLVPAEVGFHRALARLGGNHTLARVLSPIDLALARARHERRDGGESRLVQGLVRICDAVTARNAEAARRATVAAVQQLAESLR